MIWFYFLFFTLIQKNHCEIDEEPNRTQYDSISLLNGNTYDIKFETSCDTIEVMISIHFVATISCSGYLYEQNTMKKVFDCSLNKNCRLCNSFYVKELKSDTSYVFDINGTAENFMINKMVKTEKLFEVEFQPHENSIDVVIKKKCLLPVNNCFGNAFNIEDKILVFDCSNNIHCEKCENFTITKLYSNTIYRVEINSLKPSFKTIKNITTKYHLSSVFIPNYMALSVYINRSINLEAQCFGSIHKKSDKIDVFNCNDNYRCRLCMNFTIFGLYENTKYIINFHSKPVGYFPNEVSTLKFWSYDVAPKFNSFDVRIVKFSSILIRCMGYLYDSEDNIIFNCSTNQNCKICKSFIVPNLTPDSEYKINISTNFSTIGIYKMIRTEKLFRLERNISFFTFHVESIKSNTNKENCSGQIKEMTNSIIAYNCDESLNCSNCESFTVYGLKQNTSYSVTILTNNGYVFLNETFKTKPIWEIHPTITDKSIIINIRNYLLSNLSCWGKTSRYENYPPIQYCWQLPNCTHCKSFELKMLRPKTRYSVKIFSNTNETGINSIYETLNILEWSYSATFNMVVIIIKRDPHVTMNCGGKLYETSTGETVFSCSSSVGCTHCINFNVPNLKPLTSYTIDIKSDIGGASIFGSLKTDGYELKINKTIPHPKSIYFEIMPNYQSGGSCLLELLNKLKDKILISCESTCPNDCDKLNFTINNLTLNSEYTLVIKNTYLEDKYVINFYSGSVDYVLDVINVRQNSFIVSTVSNDTIYGINNTCEFTIMHLQTSIVKKYIELCTFKLVVRDTEIAQSYKVWLKTSLCVKIIKPIIVYTTPIKPKIIEYYQSSRTVLIVNAILDISQPAPVNLKVVIFDDQSKIILKDSQIKSQRIRIGTSEYLKAHVTIDVEPYMLINIGICSYIKTAYCSNKWIEFCSSCVYTRVPIYNLSFSYPGDVRLVSINEKLIILLPPFNLANSWAINCSIYVAKVLDTFSIPVVLPNFFNFTVGLYEKNYWALLYKSSDYFTCSHLSNITFGNQEDPNQLNKNFIVGNLYYVGAFRICGRTKCVSSKISDIQLLKNQKDIKTQQTLTIASLFAGLATLLCLIFILVLLKMKLISRVKYDVYPY